MTSSASSDRDRLLDKYELSASKVGEKTVVKSSETYASSLSPVSLFVGLAAVWSQDTKIPPIDERRLRCPYERENSLNKDERVRPDNDHAPRGAQSASDDATRPPRTPRGQGNDF